MAPKSQEKTSMLVLPYDANFLVDIGVRYSGRYLQNINRPSLVLQIKPLLPSQSDRVMVTWDERRNRYVSLSAHDLQNYGLISDAQAKRCLGMDLSQFESVVMVHRDSKLAHDLSQSQPKCKRKEISSDNGSGPLGRYQFSTDRESP